MASSESPARRRAYLLLEAMIGAGIVGTVLLGLMTQIGQSSADGTTASREMIAYQIAQRRMDYERHGGTSRNETTAWEAPKNRSNTSSPYLYKLSGKYEERADIRCAAQAAFDGDGYYKEFINCTLRVDVRFKDARGNERMVSTISGYATEQASDNVDEVH